MACGVEDECVRRIEVSMGEVVAHPCELRPRDVEFARDDVGVQILRGFTDLDEPDADRVERHAFVPIRVVEMIGYRCACGGDVIQARS